MKELNETDRLFQEAFEGFEVMPDPAVKENIDRLLFPKKKRRIFGWLFAGIIAGILLAGFAALYNSSKQGIFTKQAVYTASKQVKQEQTTEKQPIRSTNNPQRPFKPQSIPSSTNYSTRPNPQNQPKNTQPKATEAIVPEPFQTAGSFSYTKTGTDRLETEQGSTQQDQAATDSTATDSLRAELTDTNVLKPQTTTDKQPETRNNHWNVGVFTGLEVEKARSSVTSNNATQNSIQLESDRLHALSAYAKLELSRRFNHSEIILGLGYRSTRYTQNGSYYVSDALVDSSITTTPPVSDSSIVSAEQLFRVHSMLVPIGFAYSLPVYAHFSLRFSLGTEFAFGWQGKSTWQPALSQPTFQSFGLSGWFRPEIHYQLGRFHLIVYGTYNQPLVQQLRWSTFPTRNPLFGGGIGVVFGM